MTNKELEARVAELEARIAALAALVEGVSAVPSIAASLATRRREIDQIVELERHRALLTASVAERSTGLRALPAAERRRFGRSFTPPAAATAFLEGMPDADVALLVGDLDAPARAHVEIHRNPVAPLVRVRCAGAAMFVATDPVKVAADEVPVGLALDSFQRVPAFALSAGGEHVCPLAQWDQRLRVDGRLRAAVADGTVIVETIPDVECREIAFRERLRAIGNAAVTHPSPS